MNAGRLNLKRLRRAFTGVKYNYFIRMNGSIAAYGASSSSSTTHQNSLEKDKRGYPERTFQTEILKIDASNITFSGKGKEPFRDIEVNVADETQEKHLLKASHALQQGHLVAFPTETVYGLAGNALNEDASSKIFRAKGRPADNPLIVHISSISMLDGLVDESFTVPPMYSALINSFWPGPLTLLFPANQSKVPSVVRCGLKSLGIRMPSHPVARALIATSNVPIAAPSANVSGKPSPTKAKHVFHDMTSTSSDNEGEEVVTGRIPYIVDGGSSDVGLESTVVDGITDPTELRVLRPGGVSVEAIEESLQKVGLYSSRNSDSIKVRVYGKDIAKNAETEENPTTPGMKYRHYSPEARVIVLVTSSSSLTKANSNSREMVAQSIGHSAARKLLSKGAKEVILEEVKLFKQQTKRDHVEIGLMSMDDSKLTSQLILSDISDDVEAGQRQQDYSLHRFSLGKISSPDEAAHRLFDGLRTLDQSEGKSRSKCDLIFVEAVSDNFGVGLAIMNRLNKASSQTILVDI